MKVFELKVRLIALLVMCGSILFGGSAAVAQQQFSFNDFTSTGALTFNGSAAPTSIGSVNVLRLTPATNTQVGSVWYTTQVPLANGFSTTFKFQFTGEGGSGGHADGIAFLVQGAPTGSTTLGFGGGGIGYGDDDTDDNPTTGIPNSVAIEFDTFANPWDPNNNHVAVQSCGAGNNSQHHNALCHGGTGLNPTLAINSAPGINLTDGSTHTVVVNYVPPGGCTSACENLTVTLDNQVVLSATFDFASLGINGSNAFVGFTGATGGGFENQDVLSWSLDSTLPGMPLNIEPMQPFTFNSGTNNLDEYTVAYPNDSNLINPNATPIVSNTTITPADWGKFVQGTPFATTACIPINGANNNCAAKTQVCTLPNDNSAASGPKCPQSSIADILFTATFDAGAFPDGTVFGMVETNDTAQCPFNGSEASNSCPQNGLVFFTGPGQYKSGKGSKSSNSTYVVVDGVLAPTTVVTGFVNAAGWTSSTDVAGTLTATPPSNPGTNGMVVAPIDSISYGKNVADAGLPPTFPPSTTDTTVFSPNPPGTTSSCPATVTAATPAPAFPVAVDLGYLPEGKYLLHYSATDCAGTHELKFTKTNDSWSTNFNSLFIGVDRTKPTISGPTFSPASPGNVYALGQSVTVNYNCSDSGGSGVPASMCTGPGNGTTVSTLQLGPHTITVNATDLAGNMASQSATYTIVGAADLAVLNLASFTVKSGNSLTYAIAVLNLGPNVATNAVVTDMLPNGTTFVSATFGTVTCTLAGCSDVQSGTPCTFGGGIVTCNVPRVGLLRNLTGVLVKLVVKVTASPGTRIKDTATVIEANTDPHTGNNSSTATTKVTSHSD